MSINIKNHELKTFYNSNIALNVRFLEDAIQINKPEKAEQFLGKISDEIASAACIYQHAQEDIKNLKQFQEKLLTEVTLCYSRNPPQLLQQQQTHSSPPVGIKNASNNCWANSILQFFASAPNLSKKALESNRAPQFRQLIQNYYTMQKNGKTLEESAGQSLRELLHAWNPEIQTNSGAQEDPFDGLVAIFDTIGFGYEFAQEFHKGAKIRQSNTTRKEPMIQLDLGGNRTNFKELLTGFFSDYLEDNDEYRKLKLIDTPEDLVIQAKRFAWTPRGREKIGKDITQIPENYTLPAEFTTKAESAEYQLKGCIIHRGTELNSGHYVSLQKKSGHWYLIDDANVKRISNAEAQKLLKQGYIFHYQKVGAQSEIDLSTSESQGWTSWAYERAAVATSSIYSFARSAFSWTYPFVTAALNA